MFAFGGVTIVQKLTGEYLCRIFARFARKNTTRVPPGKLLYDGDAPKCKHFWHTAICFWALIAEQAEEDTAAAKAEAAAFFSSAEAVVCLDSFACVASSCLFSDLRCHLSTCSEQRSAIKRD